VGSEKDYAARCPLDKHLRRQHQRPNGRYRLQLQADLGSVATFDDLPMFCSSDTKYCCLTNRQGCPLKNKGIFFIAALIFIVSLASWQSKTISLGYYWLCMKWSAAEWQEEGVWLPFYQVAIEAKKIEGIEKNASGLTFNKETGTLFSVINAPPQIIEITTQGDLLRRIELVGTKDPEGITHVNNNLFVISDERQHNMYWVEIDSATEAVDAADVPRLGLAIDVEKNLGYEGVSWDSVNQILFVVKEKAPLRVLTISGLPDLVEGNYSKRMDLNIKEWKPSTAPTLFMNDLSSLSYHEDTGNLLLLSDESALIVEYAPDRQPVSIMPMWRGWHGLTATIPQAEGLASGPDGTIFVLSEPNLFYRFERSIPARWIDHMETEGSDPFSSNKSTTILD